MEIVKLILGCLMLAQARRQNRKSDLPEDQIKSINFTIGGIRSLWMGFQMDLYHNDQSKLDSRCFDKESEEEIA